MSIIHIKISQKERNKANMKNANVKSGCWVYNHNVILYFSVYLKLF